MTPACILVKFCCRRGVGKESARFRARDTIELVVVGPNGTLYDGVALVVIGSSETGECCNASAELSKLLFAVLLVTLNDSRAAMAADLYAIENRYLIAEWRRSQQPGLGPSRSAVNTVEKEFRIEKDNVD